MNIIRLTSIDEFQGLINESSKTPVFLFKHSTRCPISIAAEREYIHFVTQNNTDQHALFAHLDLIKHRDISNAAEATLSIPHQSPQAILIKNGKALWNASHGDITQKSLNHALELIEHS